MNIAKITKNNMTRRLKLSIYCTTDQFLKDCKAKQQSVEL